MKKLQWTKQEDELVYEWYNKNKKLLRTLLNRTTAAIKARAKYLGIQKSKLHLFSDNEKQKILASYKDKKTVVELSEEFGCSEHHIRKLLIENNVPRRTMRRQLFYKYNPDLSFFKTINTPEKAYFLGILYADGTNSGSTAVLGLKAEDKEILYKLISLIYPEGDKSVDFEARRGNSHVSKVGKRVVTRQDRYSLRVYSKEVCKQLSSHGCIKNKTLVLSFPDWLDPNLLPHFIRGYSDGDGWFTVSSRQDGSTFFVRWGIMSTCGFCNTLQSLLQNILGLDTKIVKRGKQCELNLHGREAFIKLGKWLYTDSNGLYLERKYARWLEIKDMIDKATETSIFWSDVDTQYLINNYHLCPVEHLSEHLNRSVPSIYTRASFLNLRHPVWWTKDEEQTLLDYYPNIEEIHNALPHRTVKSIESHIKKMGFRKRCPWTYEELNTLYRNRDLAISDLVQLFPSRSKVSIEMMRYKFRKGTYNGKYEQAFHNPIKE